MEQTGRVEQQDSLPPPEMYETSVSTSASASWSTAGSRRMASQSQNSQQSKQQKQQFRQYRGTTKSPYRGQKKSITPPPGAKPTPRLHSQEPANNGRSNEWGHATLPQSTHGSSARYRNQYNRSPHSGSRDSSGSQKQNGLSNYAARLENARRRGGASSPVMSEPNFPTAPASNAATSRSRLAAHTSRYASRSPPLQDTLSHRSDEQSGSPSVSERIQKFNGRRSPYYDHPSYAYPDEQQHRQQMYMEQQNQMYQSRQHQQQQRRSPQHMYNSRQQEAPQPTPNRASEMGNRYESSEDPHYENAGMPRHQLNHGMGGDVHPSRGRTPQRQMAPPDPHQYAANHDGMRYDAPHNRNRAATTEDIPSRYSLNNTFDSSIETPSLASVNELRQRLWDEQEALQVAVKPSLSQHGDAVAYWYDGPEMAGRQGQRVHSVQHSRQRMSRSLSPDRPQYRNRRQQNPNRSLSEIPQRQIQPQQQIPRNETVSASGAGTERDTGAVFKSRFYQAAIAARRSGQPPSRMLSADKPNTEGGVGWSDSRTQQPRSMPDPATAPSPSPVNRPNSVSPMQHKEQQQFIIESESGIERVYSQDPTNAGSDGSSVARLVQQLTSIDRKNPEAALQQIDSILRAESLSSSGPSPSPQNIPSKATRLSGYVKDQYVPIEPQQSHEPVSKATTEEEEEEEEEEETSDDEDSDDETSVSSITNPTYMSFRPKTGEAEQTAHVPDISTSVHNLPRPNALQMYGQQQQPAAYQEPVRRRSSRKKGPRTPPPDTIKVKPSSSNKAEETNDSGNTTTPQSQQTLLKPPPTEGDNNAASIALKIRGWDDTSNPSTSEARSSTGRPIPNSPGESSRSRASESYLSTVNTDDLGSLMTPSEGGSKVRRSHPWDDVLSVEPKKSDKPGDKSSDADTSFSKNEEQKHAQDMSDSFDEAWVSLPPNAFFSGATTTSNTTPRRTESPRFATPMPEPDVRPQPSPSSSFSRARAAFMSAPKTPSSGSTATTRPRNPPGQLPQSVADAFAGKGNLLSDPFAGKEELIPDPFARKDELISDPFAGKEDLLSDPFAGKEDFFPTDDNTDAFSDVVCSPSQARRSKLLAKLRSKTSKQQQHDPATFASPPTSTRNRKPLLSDFARDSVTNNSAAGRKNRRKSKSPGRARMGGSDAGGGSRGSFWRRGRTGI